MELPPPSGLLAAAAAAVGVLRCVSSASAEDAVGLRDHGSQLLSAEALAKELRGLRLKEQVADRAASVEVQPHEAVERRARWPEARRAISVGIKLRLGIRDKAATRER